MAAAVEPLYTHSLEIPDTGSLRRDLLALLHRGREMMVGRSGRILTMLVREANQHPELNQPLQDELHRRRRIYHQVLTRALARGELRADVDLDLVTELLLGPCWLRTLVSPGPLPADVVDRTVDVVLDGVARVRQPAKKT